MPAGKIVRVPRKNSAKAVANKALREVNKLKQNVEMKYTETVDSVVSTGTWSLVGNDYLTMAQGDSSITRDGEKATLQSIEVKGFVEPDGDIAEGSLIRVVLYWTADPTAFTLSAPMESDSIISFYNLNYKPKIRVLMDRTLNIGASLNAQATGTALSSYRYATFSKKIKLRKQLRWDTGTSVPTNGKLVLITIARNPLGADYPVLTTNIRCLFSDD